jgi:NTE family protein
MTKRNISKLLICGGGFKFFYLYGAIKYLDEINILQNITEYIGVSAGGLLSTMFSIGYTPKDIELFILEFNFEKLLDPHLDCLLDKKGLDNGEIKKVLIQQFMMKKNIDPDITLKQLYEKTNKKINFMAANLSLNKLEVLNYETYPDMEVWKGLLITTALPFLYEPIIHNEQFLVDGGIFDNYPIQLFKDDSLLGINMINDINNIDLNIDFLNYCTKLIELTYNWHVTHKVEKYTDYTIDIKTHNVLELINTEITHEEREKRIQHGYECAIQYFIDHKEDTPEQSENKPEETPAEIKETEEKQEEPPIEDIYAFNKGIDYII